MERSYISHHRENRVTLFGTFASAGLTLFPIMISPRVFDHYQVVRCCACKRKLGLTSCQIIMGNTTNTMGHTTLLPTVPPRDTSYYSSSQTIMLARSYFRTEHVGNRRKSSSMQLLYYMTNACHPVSSKTRINPPAYSSHPLPLESRFTSTRACQQTR